MTRNQIRNAAQVKGYKILESENHIGVNKGNDIWHWWKTLDIDDESCALFDHSYNQNTGEIKKGMRYGWKVSEFVCNTIL